MNTSKDSRPMVVVISAICVPSSGQGKMHGHRTYGCHSVQFSCHRQECKKYKQNGRPQQRI